MPVKSYGTILAFSIGVALISGYAYQKYRIAPTINFTELEAVSSDGARVRIWSQSGRGTIIVFYASWCHDCARELPKLARALSGPLNGTEVIALTDEDLPTMARYRNQMRYPFRFYALPHDFDTYSIHAIPTVYVLDAHGKVVYTKVGDVDWNSPDLIAKVRAAPLSP